ncbi:MAG: hypothetical protein Ct9H90mP28_5550 [Paracoccaceae bacterium]|nr:MAG: hypothetical protein Ct9H90mP28_5550 [Paracoccaceae bacterium]|tara:strand:+ start:304 stop:885 length:582 start_codon:yes stop_codon:yes gene_type:complete
MFIKLPSDVLSIIDEYLHSDILYHEECVTDTRELNIVPREDSTGYDITNDKNIFPHGKPKRCICCNEYFMDYELPLNNSFIGLSYLEKRELWRQNWRRGWLNSYRWPLWNRVPRKYYDYRRMKCYACCKYNDRLNFCIYIGKASLELPKIDKPKYICDNWCDNIFGFVIPSSWKGIDKEYSWNKGIPNRRLEI